MSISMAVHASAYLTTNMNSKKKNALIPYSYSTRNMSAESNNSLWLFVHEPIGELSEKSNFFPSEYGYERDVF